MTFTSEQIVAIHRAIKRDVDRLRDRWARDLDMRERKLIQVVAEAVFNLPRKPGGV